MVYKFKTPYEFDGKTYETLEFDLESLKGSDISAVKKQFNKSGNATILPAFDSDFCAMVLARVTKQKLEFFEELPARDYLALTQEVSNFLLG